MSILQKIWQRSKRSAVYLRGDTRHALGLDKALYQNAHGSRIILYHNVCYTDPHKFNTLFVTRLRFEEDLRFYKQYFNVVSLDDYYAGNFSDDKYNICLTFDDGLANNYHYVLPLLSKYQLPATFFITAIRNAGFDILWNDFLSIAGKYGPEKFLYEGATYYKNRDNKYIDSSGQLVSTLLRQNGFGEKAALINFLETQVAFKTNKQDNDYWLQLTTHQIKALASSPLVTIGAHGYYHNDLASIAAADTKNELLQCRTYLENIIDKPVKSIAFPYGSYNQGVLKASREVGYQQLLATDYINAQDGSEQDMRERFTINPFISTTNQMNAIIRGYYA